VLSAIAVLILVLIPWVGVGALNLSGFFGVFLPYVALIVFFVGLVYRIVVWACSPSPFRIPTTAGQHGACLDQAQPERQPQGHGGVLIRMAFEVLTFDPCSGKHQNGSSYPVPRSAMKWEKWLWLGALAFHYAFLTGRDQAPSFFTEPIPFFRLR